MRAYISKKNSWFRCFVSFLLAAGAAALLCVILDGPRLGLFYDFLLTWRPSQSVSGELLIIDSSISGPSNNILEPGTTSSLLYTLTELGARTLIIQVPILGLSAGGSAGEKEILSRFDEEFSVLAGNIRNLFDAIRTGSVAPIESARYVGELVELSEMGKERLVSVLVHRDEEAIVSMENAAALFGHVRLPGDLQVLLIRSGEGGYQGVLAESGEYSRTPPDRDGVIRRAAPVLTLSEGQTLEHIIYAALKTRYENTEIIEATASGLALVLRNVSDGNDRIIPLDHNGSVIFGLSQKKADFRRIGVSDFLAYEEADRNLRLLLLEAEASGIFIGIEGENHPGILYDYAFYLREEPADSFQNGNEEKKLAWIEARNRYFVRFKDFLTGPAEMALVEDYELKIASEPEDSIETKEMRNSIIRTFAALRARYTEVIVLRNRLESALSSSFCVLGNPGDTEASILLANSILTGQAVKPGEARLLLLLTLPFILLVSLLLKSRGPASSLVIGLFLSLLIGTGFSVTFVFSGLWLDPQVPAAAIASGAFVSAVWALVAKGRYSRNFRHAFGPFISRSRLKSVIRAGKPLPSEIATAAAVVVVIKKAGSSGNSQGLSSAEVFAFQLEASDIFKKAGAAITRTEGNMVSVCFGSPLERAAIAEKGERALREASIKAFAQRAVDLVSKIARDHEFDSWEFGLDAGTCGFAWTALSGYFAFGAPVQKARLLSQQAGRYKARIVISASINKILPGLPVRKLAAFKGKDGGADEPFYRIF